MLGINNKSFDFEDENIHLTDGKRILMKGTLFYFLIKIFLARINNDKKKCHFKRAKLDGFKFTNIVERQNSKLS